MNSVDIYKSIKKDAIVGVNSIQAFEASPNEKDYQNGFIFRYFTRKRNDNNGIIIEISKDTYDSLYTSSYYFVLKLRWKISGGNEFEVEQLNQRSINYAQETMGNIDTYVKNLTKFYRG